MYRVLLLFLSFLFLPSLSAQSYLGLAAGAGLGESTGLRASIPFEYRFSPYLSILSEFNLVQRRNRELIRPLEDTEDRQYRQGMFNYISVPVLAKFQLPFGKINPYASIGPEIAYALNVFTYYIEGHQIFSERRSFADLSARRWDFGLNFGLGFEHPTGDRHKIFLEYRFYLGVMDVISAAEREVYNEGSSLVMGFCFGLQEKKQEK